MCRGFIIPQCVTEQEMKFFNLMGLQPVLQSRSHFHFPSCGPKSNVLFLTV
jgi:hypothetical protein